MPGLLDIFSGPDPLPAQFGKAEAITPDLTKSAGALRDFGGPLATQGIETLNRAAHGELTEPQKAELKQYNTGLTNQARQQFYSMGRTPDQDTAFISQTADIDAKVNAMAQQQIQSSIALGLGQLSSASNFFGQSLGFDQAAISTLIQAGQAQIHQDEQYRKSLTDAFSAIGKIFGAAVGAGTGNPLAFLSLGSGGGGDYGGSPETNPNLRPLA